MSYKQFLSKVSSYGNDVKADIKSLQDDWDSLVALQGDFNNPIETIYDCYPYLFQSLFPSVKNKAMHELSVAGRLFGASIISFDDLLDKEISDKNVRKLFSPVVMQWESQKILNRLFKSEAIFWKRFDSYYKDHLQACTEEEEFRCGKRGLVEFTEETGINIAIGKNGISRAVIAGLVELSGKEDLYEPLVETIDGFNIACQVLDDVVDWKQDLKDAAPSTLLARTFTSHPNLKELEIREISEFLYYEGHAQHVLSLGLKAIKKSLKLLKGIDADKTDWNTLVFATKGKLEFLISDIDSIVQQNITRVKSQPKLELITPAPSNEFELVAYRALDFVTEQWRKGFGEARHIMNLSQDEGFTSEKSSSYRYGDVFQRALLLETLCEVANKLEVNVQPVIDYELDYLIRKRRLDKIGGWAYFPEVLEIAADADDLGQVLQSFVLAERKELALTYCEKPIRELIENNLLENGSIETWIVPKKNRDEIQEVQHQNNLGKWGIGPDTEVVANFFYGLAIYDPQRFERIVKDAVGYIESEQNADGSWDSRWYYGPFYGTYVCTKLISRIDPNSAALKYAQQFLIETQKSDGGWGDSESDQLNTSLALLALAYCDSGNTEISVLAMEFLKKSLSHGYELIDFIKPRVGEPYKSQTITAMYVCKAAATWNHILF